MPYTMKNHGRYGYRHITIELHNRGYRINQKTVQRLMKIMHLKCMVRIKKYHLYKARLENCSQHPGAGFQCNSPKPKVDYRHQRICQESRAEQSNKRPKCIFEMLQ
ncbi:MAG: transposase [Lachnospiraceae bacterium]|nr:transposase [Lachnospiraceae bacterium]